MKTRQVRQLLPAMLVILAGLPFNASALQRADPNDQGLVMPGVATTYETVQNGGMTLSEAVESVRRQGDVERIISAETRVSGGREVHLIRVMTKDGKVRTVKIPGRSQK